MDTRFRAPGWVHAPRPHRLPQRSYSAAAAPAAPPGRTPRLPACSDCVLGCAPGGPAACMRLALTPRLHTATTRTRPRPHHRGGGTAPPAGPVLGGPAAGGRHHSALATAHHHHPAGGCIRGLQEGMGCCRRRGNLRVATGWVTVRVRTALEGMKRWYSRCSV